MKPEDFVKNTRTSIIDLNVELYKETFDHCLTEQVTDPYWKDALALFEKLDHSEREVFFNVIRQVSVDTTSSIFAVLDGISEFEGQEKEFVLSTEGGEERLNGSLQDLFLELEEIS